MKFMTYNIQSTKDFITKEFNPLKVSEVIKEEFPDVISLNEVRDYSKHIDFTDNLKIISNYINYDYYYFGQTLLLPNGPYGNGLISKYPIKDITKIMIEDPLTFDLPGYYESRCIIKAVINDFTIFIIHVGLVITEQINAIKLLKKLILNTSGKIVVMGDFNMESEFYLLKELKEYVRCSSSCFKKNYNTYPSINPIKRIDYIFYNNCELVDSYVIEKVASDHFPVVAIIN